MGIVKVSGSCADYYRGIKSQMSLIDYSYIVDKYDGEIYYTDHFIGKFYNELKNLGLYDTSIIVFTSDHGEDLSDDHGGIGHGKLYDEVVKVPLIIKAPTFPKNQIVSTQAESIDIMPTVLELLRIPVPNRGDGKSLVESVKGGPHDKIFAFSENSDHVYGYQKMIRSNNWKLLLKLRPRSELELFDLKNDPKELHNIVAEKAKIAESLHEKLSVWMDTQGGKSKALSGDNKIQLDDELNEKLKALGYIN